MHFMSRKFDKEIFLTEIKIDSDIMMVAQSGNMLL